LHHDDELEDQPTRPYYHPYPRQNDYREQSSIQTEPPKPSPLNHRSSRTKRKSGTERCSRHYGIGAWTNSPGGARRNQGILSNRATTTPLPDCWNTNAEWSRPANATLLRDAENYRTPGFADSGLSWACMQQRPLAAIVFCVWADGPGNKDALFRCGALSDAGKLAISPMARMK